jgi:hypothetical protein
MSFLERLPKKEEIISVYGVIITILYSWAIFSSLMDLSRNWSLYFNVSDIFSLFAYIIFAAFVESLIFIAIPVFIYFIMPQPLVNGNFILYGTIITATLSGVLINLQLNIMTFNFLEYALTYVILPFIASTIVILFLSRKRIVREVLEKLAERCTVFLYVYLPLSLLSIIVVVVRNLF